MNEIDEIETMLILALDASKWVSAESKVLRSKRGGASLTLLDQGDLLPFPQMQPHSAYTFDLTDRDRIYTTSPKLLLASSAEILGTESEVLILNDTQMKWHGFRRLRSAPKGVACLGKAAHWYEMHSQIRSPSGNAQAFKRVLALDKSGRPLLTTIQGQSVGSPRYEGETIVLCASVIEDAHRPQTMLVSVRDVAEIRFPVPIDDYKTVFATRTDPLSPSGRRKAILHWVAEHIRHSSKGTPHSVKKHTRGIQEFTLEGFRIRIEPNDRGVDE